MYVACPANTGSCVFCFYEHAFVEISTIREEPKTVCLVADNILLLADSEHKSHGGNLCLGKTTCGITNIPTPILHESGTIFKWQEQAEHQYRPNTKPLQIDEKVTPQQ